MKEDVKMYLGLLTHLGMLYAIVFAIVHGVIFIQNLFQ